nr:hypothetical protein BgiMline_030794 [Biomphalaria glabrata]
MGSPIISLTSTHSLLPTVPICQPSNKYSLHNPVLHINKCLVCLVHLSHYEDGYTLSAMHPYDIQVTLPNSVYTFLAVVVLYCTSITSGVWICQPKAKEIKFVSKVT